MGARKKHQNIAYRVGNSTKRQPNAESRTEIKRKKARLGNKN